MRVAVIPARGGSKRIPRKNIKEFCGKPMIAWSIEAAMKSGCFDKVLVSTDDDEIADIAVGCGADVPFRRPLDLSDDFTGTNAVIVHAIEHLEAHGFELDVVACIYPTAPFLSPDKISEAVGSLVKSIGVDYSVTVTKYPYPIQRALVENKDGQLVMREPSYVMARSQDLNDCFHDAGQLYCGKPESFKRYSSVFEAKVCPVYLRCDDVRDIDAPEDWDAAEAMFQIKFGDKHD